MKQLLVLFSLILLLSCSKKPKLYDYPIKAVDIRNVHLTDNFWLPKIKTVQNTTIQYAFDKCNEEGRMDNFLIAGGKMEGTTRGEMPFDDTDLYKIIEGASYSLISSPDAKLEAYIDSIIDIIATGQEEDGYLTTWRTIDPLHPPAKWVNPGQRWEHLAASHELYNSGHMFEAAAAHYYATGKRNFLDIAIKNANLLVKTFGPGKNPAVPGHQIIETGLIKLYQITGNRKYLELSKYFLDQRGQGELRELYGPYNQDHLPVTEQNEVVGHAVRAVYMYAGMTDIAAMYHDANYLKAVNALWENMVNKKLYITGGIGARHEGESFGDNYELPNHTAYNETCAAIGSVYWNHRLFLLTGESKYFDLIEKTLYNGLISGISYDGTKFFYPNPLESDAKYEFNQGACTRQAWFDCSCCPTNLIRFIPSVPGLVYAKKNDTLFVNLYVSDKAKINLNGDTVEMIQQTNYPWDGKINIIINPATEKQITLKLRIPGWAENQPTPGTLYEYRHQRQDVISMTINGEAEYPNFKEGYIDITHAWKKGDQIELTFPMHIREVVIDSLVKENQGLIAFEYGPVVFCAEEIDNKQISELYIPEQTNLEIDYQSNLFEGMNTIKGKLPIAKTSKQADVTLIPYFAWSNRGIGKMKVWLPGENANVSKNEGE